MKEKHEQNLLKLAFYLLEGDTEHEFDMWSFFIHKECGTSACAVGHGPIATSKNKYCDEGWRDYSERVFGVPYLNPEGLWCFGRMWCGVDDTPEGAGKRILWFLYREIPEQPAQFIEGELTPLYQELTSEEIIGEENLADFEEIKQEMKPKING